MTNLMTSKNIDNINHVDFPEYEETEEVSEEHEKITQAVLPTFDNLKKEGLILFGNANLYWQWGKKDQAKDIYKEAKKKYEAAYDFSEGKQDLKIIRVLARILFRLGEYNECAIIYVRGSLHPEAEKDYFFLRDYSEALNQQGEKKEAKKIRRKSL